MKPIKLLCLSASLLLSALCAQAQQIDSIAEVILPNTETWPAKMNVALDVFLDDVSGVNAIQLKLGTNQGEHDYLQQTFALATLTVQYDAPTQKHIARINAGTFALIPPYAEARLVKQGGLSPAFTKQLVE